MLRLAHQISHLTFLVGTNIHILPIAGKRNIQYYRYKGYIASSRTL
jgi:hypothetical protein